MEPKVQKKKTKGYIYKKSMNMPRTRQSGRQQESSVKTECGEFKVLTENELRYQVMAFPTDDDSNRVRGILDDLVGIEPDDDDRGMETLETPTSLLKKVSFLSMFLKHLTFNTTLIH